MNYPQEVEMERMPESLDFDMGQADQCVLRDKNGNPITLNEVRKGYTCIIVFVRHFLDYITKEYVEDFSKIFPRHLEARNVKIVVIGCAPARFIRPFSEETNFCHEMYCDSKRIIHKVFRFNEIPEGNLGGDTSPHIKTNAFLGFLNTVWRFAKSTVEQGDPFQQGGQLVIDSDGKILFFHRDSHSLDHAPINDLLRAAGLSRIDFKLKYKIYNV